MSAGFGKKLKVNRYVGLQSRNHLGLSRSSFHSSPEERLNLMSEESLNTLDNNFHRNDHEMHQDVSVNQHQTPQNNEPRELTEKGLDSYEGNATNDDIEGENDMEDLPNCAEVNFLDRRTSGTHLNCIKARTVSFTSHCDKENVHLNSIKVRTVTSSSSEAQDMDLDSEVSTERVSSANDVLNSRADDTVSSGNSESLSVDLPHHWDRTQSEQDYESIPTCRICHCDSEGEPLISPCLCTGTVKHVHHSCLMDWLKRCVKTKCELCLQPILVDRKTKPLKQWRRPGQKPTPIIWLLTFVVALTLNIASIAKDGSQKCVSNPCIIFYVVGAIGALLGFAFFYHFLIVSIRYVKQWMALNEDWTLAALNKPSQLGNANLGLSDKSLGVKEQRDLQMVEIV